MNNKGFTLVEVLATIVILSIIAGVATYGIMGTVDSSKNKGEEIFVDNLKTAIDEYISNNSSSFTVDTSIEYEFGKCYETGCYNEETDSYTVGEDGGKTFYMVKAYRLSSIRINDLILEGFIDKDSIVNPSNNKKCFESKNPEIKVFRDEDYVYYYYVDLSGDKTDCELSNKIAVIDTLPKSLKKKVQGIL